VIRIDPSDAVPCGEDRATALRRAAESWFKRLTGAIGRPQCAPGRPCLVDSWYDPDLGASLVRVKDGVPEEACGFA